VRSFNTRQRTNRHTLSENRALIQLGTVYVPVKPDIRNDSKKYPFFSFSKMEHLRFVEPLEKY